MTESTENVVRRADRLRAPTEQEIDRIWARISSEPRADTGDDAEIIELVAHPHAEQRSTRVKWLVGAAAAVIVAVAVMIGPWGGGGVVNDVAGDGPAIGSAQPQTALPVLEVCQGSIAELAEGIEAWDTVSDWAASGDGEPDLGRLTVAALADVSELDPTASETLNEVEEALADRFAQGAMLGADLAAHEAAVQLGLGQINASIASLDPSDECDLDSVDAALEE